VLLAAGLGANQSKTLYKVQVLKYDGVRWQKGRRGVDTGLGNITGTKKLNRRDNPVDVPSTEIKANRKVPHKI
jgi:hypothetical protein